MKILSLTHFIREFFRVTWYSVSSPGFYPNLYKKYKGFGLKYLATIFAITSVIYLIVTYSNLISVKNQLKESNSADNPVSYLLSQWPEVKYSNGKISWDEENPVMIKNSAGKAIIAIDPDGKLTEFQKKNIPIIFTAKRIMASLGDASSSGKAKGVSAAYDQFFGKEELMVNADVLRDKLLGLIEQFNILLLILALPFLTIARLFSHIYSRLILVLLLYISFIFVGLKPNMKSSARIIFFAGGAAELLSMILIIVAPQLFFLNFALELWAIMLAVYSIYHNCPRSAQRV